MAYKMLLCILAFFLCSCADKLDKSARQQGAAAHQVEASALPAGIPAAAQGFTWQLYEEVLFQLPNGWKTTAKTEQGPGMTRSLFAASPEPFVAIQDFSTGLLVEVQHVDGIMMRSAHMLAQMHLKALTLSFAKENILMFKQEQQGDLQCVYFRAKGKDKAGQAIVVHECIMANEKQGKLFIITFRSPDKEWTPHWRTYGMPILQALHVVSVK